MRISDAGAASLTALAVPMACSAPAVPAAPAILCARGAAALARDCTVERTPGSAGTILTIRHPDGGFRRLVVTGGRVAAADGAEPARVTATGPGEVEVEVAGDRYRLPPDR